MIAVVFLVKSHENVCQRRRVQIELKLEAYCQMWVEREGVELFSYILYEVTGGKGSTRGEGGCEYDMVFYDGYLVR